VSIDWLDLTGRVAIVTGGGANGGNGHASAVELAKAGADVFVTDVDVAGAEQTVKEIVALGRRAIACRADNGNADEILAALTTFDRAFDHVDILVNNVATGVRKRPEEVTLEDWRRVQRVNLEGTFLWSREVGIRMIRRGKGGAIVNISSIAGSSALGRGNFVYSVTKGGINQFTHELAVEWSPHKIRVNAIQPAQINTPAWRSIFADPNLNAQKTRDRMLVGIPLDRFGEPEDVARAVVFLASDGASWITGHLLAVDGGNLALNAGGSKVWPADL
jgi:NAD(P)-dependent dehydrogenase (short-subunit alcohol dehydrogenase family)